MTSHVMDINLYSPTNGHSDGLSPGSGKLATGQSNGAVIEEEEEDTDRLQFECTQHPSDLLHGMRNLQRQNQFCDAVLRVGEREIQVHRAVLAASSPVLFEIFQKSSTTHHIEKPLQPIASMYKLRDVSYTSFAYLLDFMYSGRLNVPAQDVGEVYRSAKLLRVEQAARACAAFLAERLTPSNCLGIRKSAEDPSFRADIDSYIQKNVAEVFTSKSFFALPELKVEIIGADEALENGGSESHLFSAILDWANNSIDLSKPKVELLTEEVNVLYLNSDNHLKDCKDVDDTRMSDDDLVTDYKKHSRRRNKMTHKKNGNGADHSTGSVCNSGPLPVHVFNINPEGGLIEKEWSIIATKKQKANRYMGLAVLSDKFMSISLHLRQVAPLTPDNAKESPALPLPTKDTPELCPTLQPLETMCSSRCAFGICVWEDNIVVCGGYDRGECLTSVEAYNTTKGTWTRLPNMMSPRARFGAAAVNGKLYAICGSDGCRDLDSVHSLDFASQQWKAVASLKNARSSVGAAELDGHLYCIGGSDGQRSLKFCERYDVEMNKWTQIAPLNIARSQASVCAYKGSLIVVGGTDSWNCLNTVEMYQPAENTWTCIASLSIIRRGAGIEVMGDTMWVVGGSDGANSLRSTEMYDIESETWTHGPPLNVPRANVSAIGLNGNLYAIGGFSGKKFLNNMEVLAPDAAEWCRYQPAKKIRKSRIGSNDTSGDEHDQEAKACPTSAKGHNESDQETSGSYQEHASADESRDR